MSKFTFRQKVASRKFFLMSAILVLGFIGMCLPLLNIAFPYIKLAPLITGGEFVSLIIGTFAIYSGANVLQKKVQENKNTEELDP